MKTLADTLRALAEGATEGPWRAVAHGGSSTVLCEVEPARNDRRIPAYAYREEFCVAYPMLEDRHDGNGFEIRLDYVNFSHGDAKFIASLKTNLPTILNALDEHDALTARILALEAGLSSALDTIQARGGGYGSMESLRALLAQPSPGASQ